MTDRMRGMSVSLAARINRRRMIRNAAYTIFGAAATVSAGGAKAFAYDPLGSLGDPAAYPKSCQPTPGDGCPSNYGCGPSRCCNNRGSSHACNCAAGTACKTEGSRCNGRDSTWGGRSCWTCYRRYQCGGNCCTRVTTCCDCKTVGCGDSPARCIGWESTVYKYACDQSTFVQTSDPVIVSYETSV